ncbi:unnamed protein product [Lathyrus sativus]|nr:unnamed protein product [Lathyrus sativus]
MVDLTRCFIQLERMSLWNLATTYKNYDAIDIMDALIELLVSLAASKGMYIDWCLERLGGILLLLNMSLIF